MFADLAFIDRIMTDGISDCGSDGCGVCDVCQYLAFREEAQSIAPAGAVIEVNQEIEKHIKDTNHSTN